MLPETLTTNTMYKKQNKECIMTPQEKQSNSAILECEYEEADEISENKKKNDHRITQKHAETNICSKQLHHMYEKFCKEI